MKVTALIPDDLVREISAQARGKKPHGVPDNCPQGMVVAEEALLPQSRGRGPAPGVSAFGFKTEGRQPHAMILPDTSIWVEFFRLESEVQPALKRDEAGLWIEAGIRSAREKWFAKGVGLIDAFLIAFAEKYRLKVWTLDKKLAAVLPADLRFLAET